MREKSAKGSWGACGDGSDPCGSVSPFSLGLPSAVRRRDIANGLSNTLMVGEKRLNLGEMGQQQQDDNQGYSVGFDQDTLRHTTLEPLHDLSEIGDYYDTGRLRFGSSHFVGFNAVFADGSVHVLSYQISVSILNALGDISNHNPIPNDGWR